MLDNTEFKKYVDLIASMSVDFMMGGLDRDTYQANLKSIVKIMEEEKDHEEDNNIDDDDDNNNDGDTVVGGM
jgi:hypothetical protein